MFSEKLNDDREVSPSALFFDFVFKQMTRQFSILSIYDDDSGRDWESIKAFDDPCPVVENRQLVNVPLVSCFVTVNAWWLLQQRKTFEACAASLVLGIVFLKNFVKKTDDFRTLQKIRIIRVCFLNLREFPP